MKHFASAYVSTPKAISAVLLVLLAGSFLLQSAQAQLPHPKDETDITTSETTMTIGSSRVNSTINWESFNIDSGYAVKFDDAKGDITINKISGGQSKIYGTLDANGVIYLLNQAGILFGNGAKVNVGGLVASAMTGVEMDSGRPTGFSKPGKGKITVEGGATINAGSFAYLIGSAVDVSGSVNAGEVVIGSYGASMTTNMVLTTPNGGTITLDLGESWVGSTNAADGSITIAITNEMSTTNGSWTLLSSRDITQTEGALNLASNTVTLTAAGLVSLLDMVAENVSINADGTANLGKLDVASKLSVTAADIASDKSVSAASLDLTSKTGGIILDGPVGVSGATVLTSAGAITLNNVDNDFGGSISLASDGDVSIVGKNSINLSDVQAGTLTLSALRGDITQTKTTKVDVAGETTLSAADGYVDSEWTDTVTTNQFDEVAWKEAGEPEDQAPYYKDVVITNVHPAITNNGSILLANESNLFGGTVNATAGGDISLADADSIELGQVKADNLTVKAVRGDITQIKDSKVSVVGESTLLAADNHVDPEWTEVVTTNQFDEDAWKDAGKPEDQAPYYKDVVITNVHPAVTNDGSIFLANESNLFGGTVNATAGGDISLADADSIELGQVKADNLTVKAVRGDITQTKDSNVSVAGESMLLAADNHVDPEWTEVVTTNQFDEAAWKEAGEPEDKKDDYYVPVEVTNVYPAVTNNGAILLGNEGNTFDGTVTAKAGKGVTLADADSIELGEVKATDLNVTAVGGNITQNAESEVTALGRSTLVAATNGAITLANANNAFGGTVAAKAGGDVTLADKDAIELGEVSSANLSVTAYDGSITQIGDSVVTAKGTTSLMAEKGNITLANEGNDFAGTVTARGLVVDIVDADTLVLGDVMATEGAATLTAATGAVSVNGTVSASTDAIVTAEDGDATVAGTVQGGNSATVSATGAATVTGTVEAQDVEGVASVTGASTAVVNGGRVSATNGAATVTATGGSATIAGAVKGGKSATVSATSDAMVTDTGIVEALASNGIAKVESQNRDVIIRGTLTSAGDSFVSASNMVQLAQNATVSAGQNLTVDAKTGNIKVNTSLNAGHDMALTAGDDVDLAEGVEIKANNNLVMKVTNDLSLTTAMLMATNIGLQAGGAVSDDYATLDAVNQTLIQSGKSVTLAGNIGGESLGVASTGDINLYDVNATKLAATSSGGSVYVDAPNGVELRGMPNGVTAQRADGGEETVAPANLDGIQANGRAEVHAGSLSGSQITAGGKTIVDTGSLNLQKIQGGNVTVNSGSTTINDLTAGHGATITSGSLTVNRVTVGGLVDIHSANLKFDEMTAGSASINADNIQMGAMTAKTADITAKGSISDNNSHVKTDTLNMKAGGDIGSASKAIELESTKITSISGRSIYLREMTSGHNIQLGTISASGHLSLVAPRIGLPDGVYGFVDANGNAVNLTAGNGLELDIAGFFGQPGNPMQVKVNGPWSLRSGDLHGMSNGDMSSGTPLSFIYMVFGDSFYTDTPEYAGNGPIPGLVILNGRPVQGHPDLLRKIYSALAFTADTPELKSTQGIFGNPLFLHTDMALTEMGALGLVDYLSFMGLSLQRPDLSDLRNTLVNDDQYLLEYWDVDKLFPKTDLRTLYNQPAILRILSTPGPTTSGSAKGKK